MLAAVALWVLALAVQPASATHDSSRVKLDLTPKNATNTVGEQHCVTAEVRDTGHRDETPTGVRVVFSVSGANATPTDVVLITDADGEARFCYTGTKAGVDTISAFADLNGNGTLNPGEPSASVKKTYQPGPPTTVTVTPAAATNPVGQQHCVVATVTDRFGNPISGATVVFSVTGANAAGPATRTTDAKGQAQFCYTGTKAGVDTIRAFVDRDKDGALDAMEPVGTATKTYLAPGPTALTLNPPTAVNQVGQRHCVTATATSPAGPAVGTAVVFSVTGANTAGGTVVTGADGQATFCYTGTNAGLDVITAFADVDKDGQLDLGEPVATATKMYRPGAPATVTLKPPVSENTVGTPHCVSATVKDEFGNPTPGETVVFAVTGPNETGGSVTTDQNGNAVFCYEGTKSGLDTIRAFVDRNGDGQLSTGEPVAAPVTKLYHPGVPHTVTLDPAADENVVGDEHCVTATAHDEFGNLVGPGHKIVFSVAGANPQEPVERTTDANGQATFCYTGTKAGVDVITAFADNNGNDVQDPGEPFGVAEKTYLPGPPANVDLAPESDTNRAGEEHCVTATVTDRYGNPVAAGHPIVFEVAGANPTAAPVVVVTEANGKATFCYTGTKAGTDTITAFADNNANTERDEGEPIDTVTKTYRPGPPATVDVTPATDENVAGEEHCVTATVKDRFGNLVEPGTAVFFSVTGANPREPVEKATDTSGEATFCYTGTKAGLDTITAVADGNEDGDADAGEPIGTATKLYKPGPPAELKLSPKAATNTVGEEHCVTATVTDQFDNPTPGITVVFSVEGAVVIDGDTATLGADGSDTTDGQGEAEFCYTSELPGENVITAFADSNGNGAHDAGEPADVATKTYVLPAGTPLCDVAVRDGGWIIAVNGDKGTFGGNAHTDADGLVTGGSQQYADHGPANSLNVKSTEVLAVVCDGNGATIYLTARVESGVPYASGVFPARVKVRDSGEPGRADMYGILVGNGYYSGDEPLQGGNVQIRQG